MKGQGREKGSEKKEHGALVRGEEPNFRAGRPEGNCVGRGRGHPC